LIALACSPPPEGRDRWTLKLLPDTLVELDVVEAVSFHGVVFGACSVFTARYGPHGLLTP